MVFGKLSAMSTVIRLNTGALASILVQAMKNKGDTCTLEKMSTVLL